MTEEPKCQHGFIPPERCDHTYCEYRELRLMRTNMQRVSTFAVEQLRAVTTPVEQYIRCREWSRRTFGEGVRTVGIVEHIRKELEEILLNPHDLMEWIDVMILAEDGFWRAGGDPAMCQVLKEIKRQKNYKRQWPVGKGEDEPIMHINAEATNP